MWLMNYIYYCNVIAEIHTHVDVVFLLGSSMANM